VEMSVPSGPSADGGQVVQQRTSSNNWFILWERQLSSHFSLPANVEFGTLQADKKTEKEEGTCRIIGSGRTTDIDGRPSAGSLVNMLMDENSLP